MNTRPQEALSYRDLGRQRARISRQIGLKELPRLAAFLDQEGLAQEGLAQDGNEPATRLDVVLQFSVDPRGFSQVDGTVTGRLPLNCHGCAEDLIYSLSVSLGCFIAEGEALASKVATGSVSELPDDVLVVDGAEVTVAEIIEDEILLALPERLCVEQPCPRAPVLEYPAAEEDTAEVVEKPDSRDNPFSVLAGLDIDGKR